MSRLTAWLRRHILVLPLIVVITLVLLLAYVLLFVPGVDRMAYASPLARAPEAFKEQLRPWRAPLVDAIIPRQNATGVLERAPVTIAFTTRMNKEATQAAVHFEPAVAGAFAWADDRTLIFTPHADWRRSRCGSNRLR